MNKNRLLIVDDAMFMRQRIREIAVAAGWEIVGEAADGVEALDVYDRERPSLVTLDIVMPKMDGVAVLKEIMQVDPTARIVMVSAVNQKQNLAECIDAGAVDFIVKPFDPAGLHQFFVRYLGSESGGARKESH